MQHRQTSKPVAFTVAGDRAGRTLQDFLSEKLDVSRRRAKDLLDARVVFVNRRRVWMAKHALERGDLVEVTPDIAPPPRVGVREVLHEDGDYLVVNKPPGVLSNGPVSLEERLRRETNLPALQACHRLDRDTSGCMLLAKNASAYERAVELFRRGEVKKTYHAIVHGRLRTPSLIITDPVDGLPARTQVTALDVSPEASHARVNIETGRTHQIRRHLAAKGHPIVGDRQYATRVSATDRSLQAARQMLHSSGLAFCHPLTGNPVQAHAPLPQDFRECLRLFRLR